MFNNNINNIGEVGQWAELVGAAITTAGSFAAKQQEAKTAKKLAASQERIAQIQARAEEARARAAAISVPPSVITQPSSFPPQVQVAGIPMTYILIGSGVLLLVGSLIFFLRR